MGTLGALLRGMRESRGVSLDDMARATRVGRSHLEALEAETLADLPAPVFVKGFIRAYCAFLQLAPEEALARYRELEAQRGPAEAAAARHANRPSWNRGPVVLSAVLLVLLAGALLAVNSGLRERATVGDAAPPSEARSAARPVEAPAAPSPLPAVAPAPAPAAAPPGATSRGAQRLVVRAVEPTWVRIQMDGRGSVQELLPAGATREWSADERFVLTVGNAGGLHLELNGRALPPLGERGAVIRELVLPQAAAPAGS